MAVTSERHVPTRMCVVCRQRMPKRGLERFVVSDGAVTADPRKTLPGRGGYLCSSPECRTRFAARKARKCKGV